MNFEERIKSDNYLKAQKRVKDLKGFYTHLLVYILVNIFLSVIIVVGRMYDGEAFTLALLDFGTFSVWVFWGIGVFFHALGVLNINFIFGKKWEQRKLQQYIDKETKESKKQ